MNTFKPGDWVRYKGITQISHITHTGYHLSNGYITKGDNGEMKLWQPKVGEWCWFWNVTNFDAPTLSKFYGMQDKLFKCTNSKQKLFTHCEPFIGQLPTSLRINHE